MLDRKLLQTYNRERSTPSKAVVCHAPFTSMNFAQNGDVSACCYNRDYLLGHYPDATVEEIWLGESANSLRRAMRDDPLPRGCDICAHQLEAHNFEGLRARFYDRFGKSYGWFGSLKTPPFPKVMEFELSNVCNLECTMCNGFFSSLIRHNRERLPALKSPYDDQFVAQLEPFIPHLEAARFLGGEPFLVRTYYDIWNLIARLNPGLEVSITTNGTVVNDRVTEALEHLRAEVILSIDSLDRKTYEDIRVNARYDEVMQHLEYFHAYCQRKETSISFAVCPMRWNWRELPELVEYCSGRGIQVFFNTVVFPAGATFASMPRSELREVVESLGARMPQHKTKLQSYNAEQYRDLIRQIANEIERKAGLEDAPPHATAISTWRLEQSDGSAATMAGGGEAPSRVTIEKLGGREAWAVRISRSGVSVIAGRRQVIRFRLRADAQRRAWLGMETNQDAPQGLGLYVELCLTPEWEWFEIDFLPTSDQPDARLFLHLGVSTVAVEVADTVCFATDDSPSQPRPRVEQPSAAPA